MDLTTVARELYQLTPAEFTATRNALAKEAASAGERSIATQIRGLPKVSAGIWALNRLASDSPDVAEEFANLGERLRSAQQRADRDELDELAQHRKRLLRTAGSSAQRTAADHGVRLSASAVGEIESSLQAALADAAGGAAVFSGLLVRPIQSDGLEPVDLDGAVAGAPSAPRQSTRAPATKRTSRSPNSKMVTPAKQKARANRIERTRRAADDADASLDAARERKASLDRDREALDADVVALQAQFDRLERRRSDLDNRGATVDRDIRASTRASRDAHAAADRASESE